jgi:mannitol-1-phosphate 5-dehydrogenase
VPSPRFEHPTAVHFGAGSIGLGFIGVLLAKAGYHVIFADINPKVISHLNIDTTYTISYLDPVRSRPFHVHNISGVLSNIEEGIMQLAEDIGDRELKMITTSIGFGALKQIAPIIARGVIIRRQEGAGSLNVIACENGKGASDLLKEAVYKDLDKSMQEWADRHVGFANCSVDRIVPQPVREQEKLLSVGVDKFFGMPFRSATKTIRYLHANTRMGCGCQSPQICQPHRTSSYTRTSCAGDGSHRESSRLPGSQALHF